MAGVGGERHGFVVELEVTGDPVVELLAARGVPADVVGGPQHGELRTAGREFGWFESLAAEVAPFGIRTLLVEPGFFRTDLLTPESTDFSASTVADYAQRTEDTVALWQSMNGKQGGDPAKLATALLQLVAQDPTALRWPAGADAVGTFEQKAAALVDDANAHRELSSHLDHDDA